MDHFLGSTERLAFLGMSDGLSFKKLFGFLYIYATIFLIVSTHQYISPISNIFIDFTFTFETSFHKPLLLFFYPGRFQGRMISWHIKLLVLGPPKWQHIESFSKEKYSYI